MRCIAPKLIWPYRSTEWTDQHEENVLSVPCGKCLACLSNKRTEWIFRLEQEYKFSSGALFVTLTYDEKHNPGELRKEDVQLFMKRLRKRNNGKRIRYYLTGEYGTITGRPHYHLLLFNCTEEQHIREAWADSRSKPIGIVHVGKVTEASIAYCTKYIIQSGEGESGRTKPFALMSRGYGIGGRYLSDEMVQWHRANDALYSVRQGVKTRLCRFYKSKIWYSESERARISSVGLLAGLAEEIARRKELEKRYGSDGEAKYIEMRNAMLARIKIKVAHTQTM